MSETEFDCRAKAEPNIWSNVDMFVADGIGKAISSRLADLFSDNTPWPQRLWRVGTVGILEECLALAENRTSEQRRQYVLGTARRTIESDPALRGARRGQALRAIPKAEKLYASSHAYYVLQAETAALREEYFDLWDSYLDTMDENEDPGITAVDMERVAWMLGTHMRACGFSDLWILNHCNYYLKRSKQPSTLRSLVSTAAEVYKGGTGTYTFLVPITKRARFDSRAGEPWLSRKDFTALYVLLFPDMPVPEHNGGVVFRIVSLDKYEAEARFLRELKRIQLHIRISGSKRTLAVGEAAWSQPGSRKINIEVDSQQSVLRLGSLDVEGGIRLLERLPEQLEGALDLLSNIDLASARSASVTAWAVMETLFASEADFGALADISDRAADVLTCMYVTDALLSLATGHARAGSDELAKELMQLDKLDRVRRIEGYIAQGSALAVGSGLGAVALQRAKSLIGDRSAVGRLRTDFSAAIRRLYEVRNQVVHAGRLEPHSLSAVLASNALLLSALLEKSVEKARDSNEPAGLLGAKATWLLDQLPDGAGLASLALL
ncbi:hypothetical protein [Mycobacteroides chelonae]|uniref:hypothetical protein n=1 Tax=Mycobacteroides chelonae TaxID=1774 RepID=UPI000F50EA21|nr:hypothetical protein [Mycobacteroides chelonae]